MNLKMDNFIITSYEDWNKLIQPLIELMTKEYRNGYELVITPVGAEIRQNHTVQTFINDSIANSKIDFPTNFDSNFLDKEHIEDFWKKVFEQSEKENK